MLCTDCVETLDEICKMSAVKKKGSLAKKEENQEILEIFNSVFHDLGVVYEPMAVVLHPGQHQKLVTWFLAHCLTFH